MGRAICVRTGLAPLGGFKHCLGSLCNVVGEAVCGGLGARGDGLVVLGKGANTSGWEGPPVPSLRDRSDLEASQTTS